MLEAKEYEMTKYGPFVMEKKWENWDPDKTLALVIHIKK